ncbi:hypothetical protein AJ80_03720 [Polytolypa hystricis UAMH7299]|uniref:Carboxymuconolactone decarboxylase-like domain-containing protein n=1 Tax=Polytolypa hystricis (strain UAMH7299) TaxID=1447883 RepID=A0A2B7YFV5_POLH7|nr:hypothetical protein AJ80_03720 [Polytolypa hystricis UAMH7299]
MFPYARDQLLRQLTRRQTGNQTAICHVSHSRRQAATAVRTNGLIQGNMQMCLRDILPFRGCARFSSTGRARAPRSDSRPGNSVKPSCRRDRTSTNLGTSQSTRCASSSSSSASSIPAAAASPSSNSSDRSLNGGESTPCPIDFGRLLGHIPDQNVVSPSTTWYVVAAAALLAFHEEAAVGALWKYIAGQCERESQVAIARRIRESCLKSSVLVGFPRGINGLSALQASIQSMSPDIAAILAADTSLRAPVTPEDRLSRGKKFFSQIYANHTDRVLNAMSRSSGGDLSYYAVSSVYGDLMAEMSILNPIETVMLEFVCCLADNVPAQTKGHFFGCKNLGATGPQVDGAIEIVREIAGQLDLPRPGSGDAFGFLAKTSSW